MGNSHDSTNTLATSCTTSCIPETVYSLIAPASNILSRKSRVSNLSGFDYHRWDISKEAGLTWIGQLLLFPFITPLFASQPSSAYDLGPLSRFWIWNSFPLPGRDLTKVSVRYYGINQSEQYSGDNKPPAKELHSAHLA